MEIRPSELPGVAALSFLGDAVHSLYIRNMLLHRGLCQAGELNDAARAYVTAEAQAAQARLVFPLLFEAEADVFRRARNSGHLNRPKHASGADYRAATGWEAVLGMLFYVGDAARIEELMKKATETPTEDTTGDKHDTED